MSLAGWLELSSWGLLAWAMAVTVVLGIQLTVWPRDRQQWAAAICCFTTAIVVWRVWVAYRFGISLGNTEQGIVIFMTAAVGWAWFAYCSWDLNRGMYLARFREIGRDLRRTRWLRGRKHGG